MRAAFILSGPALVASIAYLDPGNFATNIQAGALYGYGLLWVVLVANLAAMLFQSLSAKLGIVTGLNLAEASRVHFGARLVFAMWIIGEVAAMATDLAEFVGGAIGVSLLLHTSLLAGMVVTGLATWALLAFGARSLRRVELVIGSLVAVISLCYVAELFVAPVDWASAGAHVFIPQIADFQALTIAVGIVGATIMPHAIYLHSGLTQGRVPIRDDRDRRALVRFSNCEVIVAMALAGAVNMAMVLMASAAFHAGHPEVAEIESAYHTLGPLLGPAAAGVFLAALISSGLSSSAVGTMAGQLIMQGFVGFSIPIWLRRVITMAPAFVVIGAGFDATRALVLSQVVLSLALPAPVLSLLWLTSRRDVMGSFVNASWTNLLAATVAGFILLVNVVLLIQTFFG
jgi:manganese transport protein